MATLKGQSIAASYQDLVKRADTYSQTGTNIEIMDDSAVVKPTGLYLESGAVTDNVGIGVAAPSTALDVAGTVKCTGIAIERTAAGGSALVTMYADESSNDADKRYVSVADGGLYTIQGYSTGDWVPHLAIDSTGNVGIGDTSPDAHLDVEDATVTMVADTDYVGISSNHTITAGDSDTGNDIFGITNYLNFNDTGESFGNLYGIHNSVISTETADEESNDVFGIHSTVQVLGTHSDVGNIYGSYITTDVDSGTVDLEAFGSHLDLDIESGIGGLQYTYTMYMRQDTDTNPTGAYGIWNDMATNADWAYVHYDRANTTLRVRMSAAGQIDAEGTINQSQSLDYAEYFESSDGSVIPVGTSVKLSSGKIVACSEGDTPLGVIRPVGSSAFVGGGQIFHWKDRFDKDDYGADIWEDYTLTKWSEEITFEEYIKRGKDDTGGAMGGILTDSKVEGSKEVLYVEGDELPEGKEVGDVKTAAVADTYFREHKYHSDRLPDGVTAPEDAEVIEVAKQRQKLNPDYDASKAYKSREERDEWHIVGLLGQIPVTKGQPTGSWIKMKDVSDTVEMYFVK